jgi:Tfp pilus assembly protein PilP
MKALSVAAVASAALACGSAEHKVVDQYFSAVRQGDDQTLSSFAVVKFDKKAEKWSVSEATKEPAQPAPIVAMLKQAKDAEAAFDENKKAYRAYFLQYPLEIDKVQEAMKKGAAVPANLKTHGDKWREFLDKEKELKKQVADTKAALDREKRLVLLSVGQVEDLESLTGEMQTSRLGVDVTVGGQPQRYEMTLRKYDLQGAQGGKMMSRWIVYDLQPKG